MERRLVAGAPRLSNELTEIPVELILGLELVRARL